MNPIENYLKGNFKDDVITIQEVFRVYDQNNDAFLDFEEFFALVKDVFKKGQNTTKSEEISTELVEALLKIFDTDKDKKINLREFADVWRYWLKQILKPVTALIIVDVQNDFITGSLALKCCPAQQDGASVISPINNLLDTVPFDVVIYSLDWHPENHISFYDNRSLRPFTPLNKEKSEVDVMDAVEFSGPPKTEQVLWPRHCVQDTEGSQLHPDLKVVNKGFMVHKGTNPDIDSYSAFWDNGKLSQTELVNILVEHHVTDVYICGLAYDVCVGFTATHATQHGFRTTFIEDASKGVIMEDMKKTRNKLMNMGVVMANSHQVEDMVLAKERCLKHGIKAAANYFIARNIVQTKPKQNLL
ncbi:nicotinamidase [Patella vulgata]|uniref:nicotinamidase n=1 Tax=Patella vulgata TaxID=6465 RepID=UPI00217FC475|nr:nicotinamidase [Patella vulgata]